MIGGGASTTQGSSGGYTERSASYCGSNLRSGSTHDQPPVGRSLHPDRPDPMLDTGWPVRMVRAEKGRVKGKSQWKQDQTHRSTQQLICGSWPTLRYGGGAASRLSSRCELF